MIASSWSIRGSLNPHSATTCTRNTSTTMRPMMIRARCFFNASIIALSPAARAAVRCVRQPRRVASPPPAETKAGHRLRTDIRPAIAAAGSRDRPAPRCLHELLLDEELHLHAGQLDHVVIVELTRLRVEHLAVHHREVRAFDVGNEVALRTPRDHGYLQARLAQRGQVLGELDFFAGAGAGQYLQRRER